MHLCKQYVLVILDGAGDQDRRNGLSPLAAANTPSIDTIASRGFCGRMQTLYAQLARDSLVAQMGMLGWDPRLYYPGGRASCELLAEHNIRLGSGDIAFRANFVRIEAGQLKSYSADYVTDDVATSMVRRLNHALHSEFPEIELYHNHDFRNTIVCRNIGVDVADLRCPEPHESEGRAVALGSLIAGVTATGERAATHVNRYVLRSSQVLAGCKANAIWPWSASSAICIPSFEKVSYWSGRTAIIGAMGFLKGLARAGGLDFYHVGNGRPTTDFAGKGRRAVDLLRAGYELVVCHINAPDEAAHMGNRALKIECIEACDVHVVSPILRYFELQPQRLGAIMVVPDHYTNLAAAGGESRRIESHSLDPVPFAVWNGRDSDDVRELSEDSAVHGRYGDSVVTHLQTLDLLGLRSSL